MEAVFVVLALIAIYIFIVRPKLKKFRAITGIIAAADAVGVTWVRRFWVRLSGLKTVILASAAAIMPQLPQIIDELRGFTGWNIFLGDATAAKTTAALAALTMITHVVGLVQAAEIVPVDTPPVPKA